MSDYIKRDDAKEYLHRYASEEFDKRDMKFAGRLTAMQVEKIPSADVAPVRHSYWLQDGKGFSCRSCGRYENEKSPYCRLCGSVMDGGDEE